MSIKISMSSCTPVRGVVVPEVKNNEYLASKVTKISAASQGPPGTGVQVGIQISLEQSSNTGPNYILGHFRSPIWPRTISTKATEGRQVIVNSQEEAFVYFKAANYYDCRISAYPYWRPTAV